MAFALSYRPVSGLPSATAADDGYTILLTLANHRTGPSLSIQCNPNNQFRAIFDGFRLDQWSGSFNRQS